MIGCSKCRGRALLAVSGLPAKPNNEVRVGVVAYGVRSGTLVRCVLHIGAAGDIVLVKVNRLCAADEVGQGRISTV